MFRLAVAALAVVLVAADPVPNSRSAPGINPFTPNGRIIGGEPVSIEDYPYQVSLQKKGFHFCGGSIIAKDLILTAGHCTTPYPASSITVRVGSNRQSSGGALHQVSRIERHPEYTTNMFGIPTNDIAVLKLATPITFGKNAQPIPVFGEYEESPEGSLSTISGWGTLREGGIPPPKTSAILYAVDVPVISKSVCSQAYRSHGGLPKGQICAAYPQGGKDACQGDSGGPLVIGGRQAGVTSWGNGCARRGYPGVYTEIAYFRDFLSKYI